MSLAHTVRLIACLGLELLAATVAISQTSPVLDQIKQHEQALAEARTARHVSDEGVELITLGYLYRQAGLMQKALNCLDEALSIEQSAGNHAAEAMAQNTMGRVYSDLGQQHHALALFYQALSIWRNLGIRQAEASTLTNIGRAHNDLGRRGEALNDLNEALTIWHDVDSGQRGGRMLSKKDMLRNLGQLRALKELSEQLPANLREAGGRAGEANTLDNLGETYSGMGKGREAFDYFRQALAMWREVGEQGGEALTLNSMGRAYADLGQKQKSLESFNQALSISRTIGNRQAEALTLNNTGRLYRDLGQQQTALDYFNQALPIWREVGNRIGEGMALNDIGRAYADMGQMRKALELSEQALPIWRETGTRRGEAMTLNNMGRDYSSLGETDKALEYDSAALPIWHEVEDRRGEALGMMTLGWAYSARKEPKKALASELAALSLATAAGDPEIQGGIETTLMIGMRDQHHPEDAIFFGMEAVSAYQQIRNNISGMDKDLQAGFAQSKSMTYRVLAELLIEAGRLGEAEEILDLLKEQELRDIVRGATTDGAARIETLKLTTGQEKAHSDMEELEKRALAFEQLSVEASGLHAKAVRNSDEEARLKKLNAGAEEEVSAILAYFNETIGPSLVLKSDASQTGAASDDDRSAQSYLQSTLIKLGPNVLGIRLLLGKDHAYEIVVTANARKKFELQATPAELRGKALEVIKVLGMRNTDPRPQLTQLYGMIVAPLEKELEALGTPQGTGDRVPTLLWSLDDALRYLPMGALYDGHHYMVERFNNVLFTPESYGHMTDSPLTGGPKPSVLAMGLSKSYGGLPALPGVMPELDAVVHDSAVPESHGPMEGKLLLNNQFNLAALKSELGAGKSFSVVHIASHFVVEAGNGNEPFLMLGGGDSGDAQGYEWNLSDLENSPVTFHGTRLFTLSACSTAKDYTSRNGLEMDSLGMVAQQKDAEAVLATLWDVNDASTSRLMSDFYSRWVKHPDDGKAEALRQAQIAFLRGASAAPGAESSRGFQVETGSTSTAADAGYSHPFYWAP
ncbi:MAG: tetratricopeptide repeat protein, partial [Acidobacteriaceae bacterium]|nr:tetratricopeptide repeat protein [Acidobacteriaceae bacterium]